MQSDARESTGKSEPGAASTEVVTAEVDAPPPIPKAGAAGAAPKTAPNAGAVTPGQTSQSPAFASLAAEECGVVFFPSSPPVPRAPAAPAAAAPPAPAREFSGTGVLSRASFC